MDGRRRTWLVWIAAMVSSGATLPVALIPAGAGQDGTRRVIQVRIERRKVIAPRGAIRVTEKDVVALRWSSDEAVKLHLHGYDMELQLRPGEAATMSITAHATGRFPITSHGWGRGGHGHHALTYLEVYPR